MTVLFEKRNIPIVSVGFAVRNGGVNEALDEKWISHFIEHMLYKGNKKRDAKKIAEEIEKRGGELNGFTDESITAYWCKIPSRHLKIALDVLGEMVKNPIFDEKERKVIFEEIKMRKDNPRIYVYDIIQGCLYETPFGKPLIGDEKTMKSIDREKIVKKFQEVYQPDNMILCVVGDCNFSEVVDYAEKNFGNKKGIIQNFEIKNKNEIKNEKRKGIDQVNLVFAYHTPFANDKKSYASLVLGTLMAGGMSSRLFSEIREKRNLAYSIKGDSVIDKSFAYNTIYVLTTEENLELVKKLILEEFEKVQKSLDEKELNQVKEQLIGNYHISMEDSHIQMVNLLLHEINGNAKEFYEFEKNISKVNLNDVKELARFVKDGNYSIFSLVPES